MMIPSRKINPAVQANEASPELDRVLAAFGRIEPSAGLDARLFAALAAHRPADERARVAGKSLGLRLASPRAYRLQAALVATVLAVVAATVYHGVLRAPAGPSTNAASRTATAAPRENAGSESQENGSGMHGASAPSLATAAARARTARAAAESSAGASAPSAHGNSAPGRTASAHLAQTSEDELAFAELRAPSQPAPSQPLSAEEQLLIRRQPHAATQAHTDEAAEPPPAPAGNPAPGNVLSALREGLFAGLTPTTNE